MANKETVETLLNKLQKAADPAVIYNIVFRNAGVGVMFHDPRITHSKFVVYAYFPNLRKCLVETRLLLEKQSNMYLVEKNHEDIPKRD